MAEHLSEIIAMPYTAKQRRLFNAAANDPEIAKKHGMSKSSASKLASEANRLSKKGQEQKSVKKSKPKAKKPMKAKKAPAKKTPKQKKPLKKPVMMAY